MRKRNITLKYGMLTSFFLIAYFLLLSLVGLHTEPIFSLMNAVITGVGIYYAIKTHKQARGKDFKYYDGFVIGIFTGFLATMVFTLFFGVYASNLQPAFLEMFLGGWRVTDETGLGLLLFVVAVMGLTTTLIITFTFMQLLKESWNLSKPLRSPNEIHHAS